MKNSLLFLLLFSRAFTAVAQSVDKNTNYTIQKMGEREKLEFQSSAVRVSIDDLFGISVAGPFPSDVVKKVLRTHLEFFAYCFERGLKGADDKARPRFGSINLQYTILTAYGDVQDAKVVQSTLKSEFVEKCTKEVIQKTKYPEATAAKFLKPSGDVTVAIRFKAGE